ncbi:LOW QUALITY PROTEIN: hypothetical protein CFOL_v3_12917, partial [Cephalotus follicularis]
AIEVFKYGRSVICVDDTHLYGKYKGKLPIALENHAYHRFCVRHLDGNFNATFKSKVLKTTVYLMAVVTQQRQFDSQEMIEDVEEGRVALWLNNISRDKWTLLYDQGSKWGDMMTNMIEIFNGVLKGARGLPVTAL